METLPVPEPQAAAAVAVQPTRAADEVSVDALHALTEIGRQLGRYDDLGELAEAACALALDTVPGVRAVRLQRLLSSGRTMTVAEAAAPAAVAQAPSAEWAALPLDCDCDSLVLQFCPAGPWSSEPKRIAVAFAAELALAVRGAHERNRAVNLERALQTARDIGVAMGIIMARRACTRDEAFDLLRRASRTHKRKLAGIAADVAETGILEFELDGRGANAGRLAGYG